MRKYSSNLAFVDLLFNLLVGFTSLFVIAFLLINPISKTGVIDPPIKFMVELTWADDSSTDMDLYIRGPDGSNVFYANRTNGYITLKRDDLGTRSDTFVINGVPTTIHRNYEVTSMTALPDGDYIVNVFWFGGVDNIGTPEEVSVRVTSIQPFGIVYENNILVSYRQESTAITFRVANGKIVDMRTDVSVKLRGVPQ